MPKTNKGGFSISVDDETNVATVETDQSGWLGLDGSTWFGLHPGTNEIQLDTGLTGDHRLSITDQTDIHLTTELHAETVSFD